ncbi:MAG: O-sialoglycoprotein endopeptidase [Firmicutes bacterium]|nr:O-sialoglycoprotein endopeptidase [Bacillota bacterium]
MTPDSGLYFGIDTSNYTTSACAIDERGRIEFDMRKTLPVAHGERGLAQSEALFGHLQALPQLLEHARAEIGDERLARGLRAVCVSDRPRPAPDSYMPVFRAGVACAQALATGGGAPLFTTTHQHGHIYAGLRTAGLELGRGEAALCVHLSGGTTEVVRVVAGVADLELAPLTRDIDLHAGQFIDRVGVALGLRFPAGPQVAELAASHDGPVPVIPAAVRAGCPSFSGPESAALRLIASGAPPSAVAAAVLRCVAASVEKMVRFAQAMGGDEIPLPVLLVGGVASNAWITSRLRHRFGDLSNSVPGAAPRIYACQPRFSVDNAYGVALAGLARSTTVR